MAGEVIPRIVGRYALYGEIGSGGMATVRFGRLLGTVGFSRQVAVKCLHPQYAKDAEFRAMFMDEARLAARIAHPNVVPTLDVVAADGELFLVMEYVAGESLARLRRTAQDRGEPVPIRVAVALVINVLLGLHAAHEARGEGGDPLSIVHRDVSPSNVLVGADGVARLLDFGVARAAVRLETTQEGRIKGKLAYMAPEQLGGAEVGRTADVYAASVVLWELLTGRRLFGASDAPAAVVERMLGGPVEPPSRYRREVSPAIDAVTRRGLERDPSRRFSTAGEMAVALELASAGEIASASEIARWVQRLASGSLASRAQEVVRWESLPLVLHRGPSAEEAPRSPWRRVAPLPDPKLAPVPLPLASSPTSPTPDNDNPIRTPHAFSADVRGSLASILEPRTNPRRVLRAPSRSRLAWSGAGVLFLASVWLNVRGGQDWLAGVFGGRSPSATAGSGIVTDVDACPDGMVTIPGQRFLMGDDSGFPDERPAHVVTLSRYCIDVHEVTVADYERCVAQGSCTAPSIVNQGMTLSDHEHAVLDSACTARGGDSKNHPINCVDWSSANAYCRSRGSRLPTEAEWEFSARGPDGRKFAWGNDEPALGRLNACGKECAEWGRHMQLELGAMYPGNDGWAKTAPVGSFAGDRSRFGVEDTAGNVAEWVADRFGPYASSAQVNPLGPNLGSERVVRGGAWSSRFGSWVRATFRDRAIPEARSHSIGFRCAR